MTKLNFKSIIWFLFFLLIFVFLVFNSLNSLDPDLGWHLRVGGEIIANRAVPNIETFDYPLAGQQWVDHEWLLNVISYTIYHNFGYNALCIFFSLINLTTFVILARSMKNYLKDRSDFIIGAFIAFGVFACSPHLGVRMQDITILFLLLLLLIIRRYNERKNIMTLYWLPPLFIIWANCHAGYLIGLFVLFFWIGIKIAENILVKFKFWHWLDFSRTLKAKYIWLALFFAVLSALATLLTPYGLKLYGFLSGYTDSFYMTHIAEWLPAWRWPFNYYMMAYSSLVVSALAIILITAFRTKKGSADSNNFRLDLWQFALVSLFFLLSVKSKRHAPLFFIVSFPLIIMFIYHYLITPWHRKPGAGLGWLFRLSVIVPVCFAIVYLALNISFTADPFTSPRFCREYPCAAVAFMKNDPRYLEMPIFNNYGWGGFMIWTWPEKKLFLDGRLPQERYGDRTILEEYYDFFGEDKSAEMLEKHGVRLVLLKLIKDIKLNWFEKYVFGMNEEKINKIDLYLQDYLDTSPDWQLVYSDDISHIYEKK